MVPQTYPSILNPYTNRHEMVVKQLASTSGLQRWTDYIPVKLSASTRPAGEQTTDGDGFIAINTGQDTSTGVAFKDWVPVYFDNDATDAWVVSASGYIPIGASGGAIAILKSYGTDAHVYLPGANGVAVSGLPTNNYTLSNGSTGYSAVDGTAGLVLDGAGSVGSELVTNGTNLVTTTGWTANGGATLSVVSGALRVTNGAAAFGFAAQSFATVIGQTYYIPPFYVGANPANTANYHIGAVPGGATDVTAANAALPRFFVASQTTSYISVYAGSNIAGNYTDYNNISVKQVTGIHATQATTSNKCALRRGVYNRFLGSNDLANTTYWVRGAGGTGVAPVVTAGHQDPFGGTSAYRCVLDKGSGTTTSDDCRLVGNTPNSAPSDGTTRTMAVWLKSNTAATYTVQIRLHSSPALASVTPTWTLFAVSGSDLATDGTTAIARLRGGSGSSDYADILVYNAGLFQGTLTAAQILSEGGIPLTTSAAASNQSAGRYSWQFDGSNDSLALGSVPFQMSDDHCVIAGWRADVFQNSVVAPSHTSNTARYGSIGTSSGGNGIITEWYDGTQYVNHQTVVAKGSVNVTSATKASGTVKSRNNGVSFGSGAAFSTAVQGNDAAISPTSALGIFTGAIGPVIVIKGTVSDADLLTLERWVAANTLGAPSF